MLIWFAILIPLAIAAYLARAHGRSVTRWELVGLLAVALATIGIAKVSVDRVLTDDTEYWGGWIEQAAYYEDWNERVTCSHTKYRTERYTTTEDGRTVRRTRRVPDGKLHAYDVDYHPAYWEVVDSNGITIRVGEERFNALATRFGNRQQVELNRHYHTDDGDKIVTEWQGNPEALEPCVTRHTYENRVQASHSLYRSRSLKPADRERYQLYDYPEIRDGYVLDSLLGDGGLRTTEANAFLNRSNARLGASKQVRMWVLVFRDQPRQAGLAQEDYWLGGNKNEFVLTVGVDGQNQVQWAHPFSWTKAEDLKIDARNFVQEQERFDPMALAVWLDKEIEARFVRRPFKEFSYLTVEPPLPKLLLSYGVVMLVSGVFAFWAVRNDYRNKPLEAPAPAGKRVKRMATANRRRSKRLEPDS